MLDQDNSSTRLVPANLLGGLMYKRSDLWQMKLLSEGELVRFARERGLRICTSKGEIYFLWRLGLLRADVVRSTRRLRWRGLDLQGKDVDDRYVYLDARESPSRKSGWVDVPLASRIGTRLPSYLRLEFHPFRLYTLYQLDRVLSGFSLPPAQFIYSTERIPHLIDLKIRMLRSSTQTEQFAKSLKQWHDTNDVAVLVEPCAAKQLLGSLRISGWWDSQEQALDNLESEISKHRDRAGEVLKAIGLDQLERFRKDLCTAAELLDPNRDIHVLLRLTNKRWRQLKGSLGASMYLLAMAESIRRSTEHSFSTQLPEEDEMGFGLYPEGLKKKRYGGKRIIDGARPVRKEFVRSHGLDFGVRARCYVEGATELGALQTVFDAFSSVELIDLRADFGKKGTRAGGLRNHLKRDQKESVFSFLFFDGDQGEPLRIARRAAQEGILVGEFYVARPDFELNNFTDEELVQVVQELAIEMSLNSHPVRKAWETALPLSSGRDLQSLAAQIDPRLSDEIKGSDWGRRLMEVALRQPDLNDTRRPVLRQVDRVLTALRADYKFSRESQSIDPETGMVISK